MKTCYNTLVHTNTKIEEMEHMEENKNENKNEEQNQNQEKPEPPKGDEKKFA